MLGVKGLMEDVLRREFLLFFSYWVRGLNQGLPGVGVYPGGVKPRPRFLAPGPSGS